MKKIRIFYTLALVQALFSVQAADYAGLFESARQSHARFENKGTEPVSFIVLSNYMAILGPKEIKTFTTDEGFSYIHDGKRYRKFVLNNEANDTMQQHSLPYPQMRGVNLSAGESVEFDVNHLSYFTGIRNIKGIQNHLSWDVNEAGLNVLLGVPYPALPSDLDQQMVLYKKYFEHDPLKINSDLYYESMSRCKGTTTKRYDKELIVSLTTWAPRISTVWLTIESLMRQDVKPNRIILWLAKEEFPDKKLPIILTHLESRGLEIRYCENLKSAKKLIPTLREFPNATVITVDDDIIYPEILVKSLMQAHTLSPHTVFANRGRAIRWNQDKTLSPYVTWPLQTAENMSSSEAVLQTGCGGVLYPENSLSREVFDVQTLLTLAPRGDDIWFFAMALLNNTLVKMITPVPFRFEDDVNVIKSALFNQNKKDIDGNDTQIQAVFSHYNLYEKLGDLREKLGRNSEIKSSAVRAVENMYPNSNNSIALFQLFENIYGEFSWTNNLDKKESEQFFFYEELFSIFCYKQYFEGPLRNEAFISILRDQNPREIIVNAINIREQQLPCFNVALFLMVKNESDIILENLSWHYFMGFRVFFIIDNGSDDDTVKKIDIFRQKATDVKLHLISDKRIEYLQTSRSNAISYLIQKQYPNVDFIFPNDADEFLVFDKPISCILSQIPNHVNWGYIPRFTYLPKKNHLGTPHQEKFFENLDSLHKGNPHGRSDSLSMWNGKCFFRTQKGIMLVQGNHFPSRAAPFTDGVCDAFTLGAHIREFPVRSIDQLRKKTLTNGKALECLDLEKNRVGKHYADHNFDEYKKRQEEAIHENFMTYMRDNPDLVEIIPIQLALQSIGINY
ncbi:MAG: hypothetical protein COY39_02020 [Alphaproteobacteria bacterium CG_4_10_14_0_8_um_filter_37_21]|nr:MAG: hypothetical protein COY39_02020 [Alphaproteobacteria bacterium CG_4_10_14_0_8_um_filter_37_21]